ncbi:VOC family protein [Ralstonia pickettii]|uniref:VOC family protein n=1 Tax=Ralstonia pickettii TaxID=329 RepID=A0A7X2HK40_RALPI|nr:VOC family protein [Ralstonia pickettii]MRS97364.1 VOC family protein [Ralstonia pickettii]
MSLTLDHIVIRVNDLERVIADYAALGFNVQRGGTHADGVTHNALVGFADGSYLELIAFLQPAPERRWWSLGERHGEGYVDFALLPHNVGAVVDAARARGLDYEGPLPGGRLRPDGAKLVWELGRPATPDLPFLCGDVTPRHLRVREGEVRVHANGVQGIASVTVAVQDIETSLARYRALLGSVPTPQPVTLAGVGIASAVVPVGDTALVLVSPLPDSGLAAAVDLEHHLATRGEGVLGLTLSSAIGTAASLPVEQTHGARISVHPTADARHAAEGALAETTLA